MGLGGCTKIHSDTNSQHIPAISPKFIVVLKYTLIPIHNKEPSDVGKQPVVLKYTLIPIHNPTAIGALVPYVVLKYTLIPIHN